MAASDHLNPAQFLYHVTGSDNRDSIHAHGLLAFGKPGHREPAVYASEQPVARANYDDVWRIDASQGNWQQDPGRQGHWTSSTGIPAEHIRLDVAGVPKRPYRGRED